MTMFAERLRAAGVDVDKSTLRIKAEDALRAAEMSHSKALALFADALIIRPQLIVALLGRDGIAGVAEDYLQSVARDMEFKNDGREGAQASGDSQSPLSASRPSPNAEREGAQLVIDGQCMHSASRSAPTSEPDGAPADADSHFGLSASGSDRITEGEGAHLRLGSPRNPRPSPSVSIARRGSAELRLIAAMAPKSAFDSIILRNGVRIGDLQWSAIDRLIGENTREARMLELVRNYATPAHPNDRIRDVVPPNVFERMWQKSAELVDA